MGYFSSVQKFCKTVTEQVYSDSLLALLSLDTCRFELLVVIMLRICSPVPTKGVSNQDFIVICSGCRMVCSALSKILKSAC